MQVLERAAQRASEHAVTLVTLREQADRGSCSSYAVIAQQIDRCRQFRSK